MILKFRSHFFDPFVLFLLPEVTNGGATCVGTIIMLPGAISIGSDGNQFDAGTYPRTQGAFSLDFKPYPLFSQIRIEKRPQIAAKIEICKARSIVSCEIWFVNAFETWQEEPVPIYLCLGCFQGTFCFIFVLSISIIGRNFWSIQNRKEIFSGANKHLFLVLLTKIKI